MKIGRDLLKAFGISFVIFGLCLAFGMIVMPQVINPSAWNSRMQTYVLYLAISVGILDFLLIRLQNMKAIQRFVSNNVYVEQILKRLENATISSILISLATMFVVPMLNPESWGLKSGTILGNLPQILVVVIPFTCLFFTIRFALRMKQVHDYCLKTRMSFTDVFEAFFRYNLDRVKAIEVWDYWDLRDQLVQHRGTTVANEQRALYSS